MHLRRQFLIRALLLAHDHMRSFQHTPGIPGMSYAYTRRQRIISRLLRD